ncbi:MAG: hypothetical protein E7262_01250 [Lachnospiraceae bacterium]|nr:hypothetical protein [Lachnospiraceae bacterium]
MEEVTMSICIHSRGIKADILVPLEISANELIIGLNEAFSLGMDTTDMSKCFLRTESPIALLKGNTLLKDFGLRNGTIINCF